MGGSKEVCSVYEPFVESDVCETVEEVMRKRQAVADRKRVAQVAVRP